MLGLNEAMTIARCAFSKVHSVFMVQACPIKRLQQRE
jgi:hypothetical protein